LFISCTQLTANADHPTSYETLPIPLAASSNIGTLYTLMTICFYGNISS